MRLSDQTQQMLRSVGRIQKEEILIKEGDILVAVNVVNQSRRIVERDSVINEILSNTQNLHERRVLKG